MTRRIYGLRTLAARGVRRLRRLQRETPARRGGASEDDTSTPTTDPPETAGIDGYLCEVVAWSQEKSRKGDGQEIYLGGYWADTPQAAVRWLCAQAVRLADRLDPQPGQGWAQGNAGKALRRLPDELPEDWPDPGQTLRGWCTDEKQRQETAHSLMNGEPFILATRDCTAFYSLTARPALLPWGTDEQLHHVSHAAA